MQMKVFALRFAKASMTLLGIILMFGLFFIAINYLFGGGQLHLPNAVIRGIAWVFG